MIDENKIKHIPYAGRNLAPDDYEFSPEKSTLQILTSKISGNNVISQVIQIDDNFSRVLWSRLQEETEDIPKNQKSELQAALDWQLARIKPNIRDDDASINILTRISAFFMTLGRLIDGQAFPQRETVNNFIDSAISFLYEKDDFVEWITRWQDIAKGGRKPRRKEPVFIDRLLPIDKTSRDSAAQWLGIRKPFHDPLRMRWLDEIVSEEAEIIGRELTTEEKNKALARAGEYIAQDENGIIHFYSDKGDFSISITPNILNMVALDERRQWLEKRLKEPDLFDDDRILKQIRAELDAIDLYAGAFKTIQICGLYYQNQFKTDYFQKNRFLKIPKEDIPYWTGEDGKNGYRTFKRWLRALYHVSVNFKEVDKKEKPGFSEGEARFIFHYDDKGKYYTIGYNETLWAVTREIVELGRNADKKLLSERRYYYQTPRLIAEDLSAQAFYYADWITSETGNNQIKDIPDGQKVIAFNGETHCNKANIQQARREKKPKQMISVWRELLKREIIFKTEPNIKTLDTLTPKAFLKQIIRVYAWKDNHELNELLRQRQTKK